MTDNTPDTQLEEITETGTPNISRPYGHAVHSRIQ